MLRNRNFLKFHKFSSTPTPTTQTSSGIGRFVFLNVVGFGSVVGIAYLREHDKIPFQSLTKQLEFLQPIQDFLRIKGYGKVVSPPSVVIEEAVVDDHKEDYVVIDEPEEIVEETVTEVEPKIDVNEIIDSPAPIETLPEPIQPIIEEVQPAVKEEIIVEAVEPPSPPEPSQNTQPSSPTPAPTPSSSDRFLQLRVETLDNLLEDIARQTAELKSESEKALFRDLENLDEQSLRYRIVQLSAEFFDRIKWEGLRQQQLLRDAEATFAQKYGQLLSDQNTELNFALEKKLLEKEKELLTEHQRKISELSETYEKRLAEALSNQALLLTNSTKSEVEKSENLLRIQLQEEFTHQLAMLRQEHVKKSLQAQEAVIEQSVQLKNLRELISTEFGKTTVSSNVHGLSAAVLLIQTALLSGASVQNEIEALKVHAKGFNLFLFIN